MLTTGTIDTARTRWQYLFPEGLREEYPRENGKPVVTTYTAAWCKGMVDRFHQFCAASEAHGMPAQPLPVQLQHVGILGTATTAEERRRVGSVYDLHYVAPGSAIPPCVWSLIEWTAEGLDLISSGRFNCLSPTNSRYMVLSTGRKIAGDSLEEVSLVDRPFLESIGTAADYLPFGALPYAGSRSFSGAENTARSAAPAWARPHATGDLVLTRGAIYRSSAMPEDTSVEVSLKPEQFTPELLDAIMSTETARAKVRAMCREYMESDMGDVLETMGYMKREMASPTLPDTTAAEESVDISARARKVEDERLETEAIDLVKSGKLLAIHANDYMVRSRGGKPVDDLLRDRSAASLQLGVAGSTPRETPPVNTAQRTAADIVAETEREFIARGKFTASELNKAAETRIAEARAKGVLKEV
jgi:hypothetical protein